MIASSDIKCRGKYYKLYDSHHRNHNVIHTHDGIVVLPGRTNQYVNLNELRRFTIVFAMPFKFDFGFSIHSYDKEISGFTNKETIDNFIIKYEKFINENFEQISIFNFNSN